MKVVFGVLFVMVGYGFLMFCIGGFWGMSQPRWNCKYEDEVVTVRNRCVPVNVFNISYIEV